MIEEDLLDIRDFENVNKVTNTYAGHKRQVIDLLREDLENTTYPEGPGDLKTEDFDPKELMDVNFEAHKYA